MNSDKSQEKNAQLCKPNNPISPVSVARIVVELDEKWIESEH